MNSPGSEAPRPHFPRRAPRVPPDGKTGQMDRLEQVPDIRGVRQEGDEEGDVPDGGGAGVGLFAT